MDDSIDKSDPFDDGPATKLIRPTADSSHVSGWNPINRISKKSTEDWAHGKSDPEYSSHNALDEEPIDPGFDEKYFDHYGYINYINSSQMKKSTTTTTHEQQNIASPHRILDRTPKRPKTSYAHLSRATDEPTDPWERDTVSTRHSTPIKKPYTAEEDAWLDLFHAKIRGAIEAGAVTRVPGPPLVLQAFNTFFKNKYSVQEEEDGGAAAGESEWTPRSFGSMYRKLRCGGSKVGREREKLSKLVGHKKHGRMYIPELSAEEVEAYQRDRTVVLEDVILERREESMVDILRECSGRVRKRKFGD
ncbi:hypothetical protein COCC4DRAFT_67040 [Bipolaris maydis ATCC 48331]|uniref:Uncharacterized protein n=2 Tax=Cochliobolus heterostrophus TaxID=5016 RepID=M2V0X1_COCH5|nr:uncharacterized protein COCC4DRAFT_67040 [Bipolaris maydis ATCC 48331]EMD93678.1 hypothetical protein COCHEDRAFT_1095337 [Bipolaris maydis C5]KAJ5020469.1 hypothetical protein J3E73DRAFT_395469 [Bipolaris maydis]ENH98798.1 hypothetical protein COCC4DRAFT_67040 [Bipolaris maydis ATCC 48331]KAJ5020627.1 hypothetical protein J3E73DRAFT_395340 [Bipolaris maydis]KAJ5027970.1 hypothetical protein J3E73DRAFT_186044 [Bipolaris maydis]